MNRIRGRIAELVGLAVLAGVVAAAALMFSTAGRGGRGAAEPTAAPAVLPTSTGELTFKSPVQPPTATPVVPTPTPTVVPPTPVATVTYISRTLIVAKVGDGPGEIGIKRVGDEPPAGPGKIAVDGAGSIYITDAENYRVVKFDHSGNFLYELPFETRVTMLCIDDEDSVYIYHYNDRAVKKYDKEGRHVRDYPQPKWVRLTGRMEWGKEGHLLIEGSIPSLKPGTMAAIRRQGGRGDYVIAALGTRDLVFAREQQLATARMGTLYQGGVFFVDLAADDDQTLVVFDPSGQLVARLPLKANLYFPTYFGVDVNGYMYVGLQTSREEFLSNQHEILVFDPHGNKLATLVMRYRAYTVILNVGITFDDQGNIYRLETYPDRVEVIKWERQ